MIDHFQDGSDGMSLLNISLKNARLALLLLNSCQEVFKNPLDMNGDVLTRLNLRHLIAFHNEHKAAGTLYVREHTTTVPFGVVETNGVRLSRLQKNRLCII